MIRGMDDAVPDTAHARSDAIAPWAALLEPRHAALLAAADAVDPFHPAAIERLRRTWDPDLCRTALHLVQVRRLAQSRFPEHWSRLVADREGLEQATSSAVARCKAQRFAGWDRPVVDFCCGIGGDLMGLVECGIPARGVDLDPLRAWMARVNTGCRIDVAAAEARLPEPGEAFHIDPARRAAGRRLWRLEDLRPGAPYLRRLLACGAPGAVKLGPGTALPEAEDLGATEIEIVGEGRRLVQMILWTEGAGSAGGPALRRATRLPAFRTIAGTPRPLPAPMRDPEEMRLLLVPDPALERAGLLGRLAEGCDLAEVWPGLGLLACGPGGPDAASLPEPLRAWCEIFEVRETCAWRVDRVASRLRAQGLGASEIRTRGQAIDPDLVRPRLPAGDDVVVFGLRLGARRVAIIAEKRCDSV
ncbi:MAG: hypothetical protein KF817_14545 [Phycisphaeraceae bacterium]|nr:hypothetical protein [Phycisphaeraceae bacterium]